MSGTRIPVHWSGSPVRGTCVSFSLMQNEDAVAVLEVYMTDKDGETVIEIPVDTIGAIDGSEVGDRDFCDLKFALTALAAQLPRSESL